MKLTQKNYETYLVDYLDGKLTPLEVAELLLFLEQHPHIKAEFESFDCIVIDKAESEAFPDKQLLKKENSNTLLNFDCQLQELFFRTKRVPV